MNRLAFVSRAAHALAAIPLLGAFTPAVLRGVPIVVDDVEWARGRNGDGALLAYQNQTTIDLAGGNARQWQTVFARDGRVLRRPVALGEFPSLRETAAWARSVMEQAPA